MTPRNMAYGRFEVRTRFAPGTDTDTLTEDAHGLVYARQLAMEIDDDKWGFGRTWYEPPHTADGLGVVTATLGVNLNFPDSHLVVLAAASIVMDTLSSVGEHHAQDMTLSLPSTVLRPAPSTMGHPLWMGLQSDASLTVTAAVDGLNHAEFAERVDWRVRASTMPRFHRPAQVPMPESFRQRASHLTYPLTRLTQPPNLSSALEWQVDVPAVNADAAAWVLGRLAHAMAAEEPRPSLVMDVTLDH